MTKRKALSEFLDRALNRAASRAELARTLGVSRSTVQKWTAGRRAIPERYRAALRSAALGHTVKPPPAPTTKSGTARPTAATVTTTALPGGGTHFLTHSRKAFAAQFGQAVAAGTAPDQFSVLLHGFRSIDSPEVKARQRRLVVKGLTPAEKAAIGRGDKRAMDDVITRAIQATNYDGGFTFRRGTAWNWET